MTLSSGRIASQRSCVEYTRKRQWFNEGARSRSTSDLTWRTLIGVLPIKMLTKKKTDARRRWQARRGCRLPWLWLVACVQSRRRGRLRIDWLSVSSSRRRRWPVTRLQGRYFGSSCATNGYIGVTCENWRYRRPLLTLSKRNMGAINWCWAWRQSQFYPDATMASLYVSEGMGFEIRSNFTAASVSQRWQLRWWFYSSFRLDDIKVVNNGGILVNNDVGVIAPRQHFSNIRIRWTIHQKIDADDNELVAYAAQFAYNKLKGNEDEVVLVKEKACTLRQRSSMYDYAYACNHF